MTAPDPKPERRPTKPRSYGSTLPRPTKPINPISTHKRRQLEELDASKQVMIQRSGGRCEMPAGHHVPGCDGRGADPHHIRPQSLTLDHTPGNLAHLSRACHMWAEEHPAEATALGVSNIPNARSLPKGNQQP